MTLFVSARQRHERRLKRVEEVVRAEINAAFASFDFDPAPRVVQALYHTGALRWSAGNKEGNQ